MIARPGLVLCCLCLLAPAVRAQRARVVDVREAEPRAALAAAPLNPPTGLTARPVAGAVRLTWTAPSPAAPPVPGGRLDEVEPNNARGEAQALGGAAPVVVGGNAEAEDQGDLVINFTDGTTDDLEDLYVFTLTAAGVSLTLGDLIGDCDLYVLSTDLQVLGTSTQIGLDDEAIMLDTLAPGTYFIGVTLFDDDPITSPTPYTLTLTGALAEGPVATLEAYRIYRAGQAGAFALGALVTEVSPASTGFVDLPPAPAPLFYQVTARYDLGESGPSNEAEVTDLATARTPDPALPEAGALGGSFPNPFRHDTRIPFRLAAPGPARLVVYDVHGRRVRTLVARFLPAGSHQVRWDGRTDAGTFAPPGVYFYRIRTPQFDLTRALVRVR